jgi:hypothetical protein
MGEDYGRSIIRRMQVDDELEVHPVLVDFAESHSNFLLKQLFIMFMSSLNIFIDAQLSIQEKQFKARIRDRTESYSRRNNSIFCNETLINWKTYMYIYKARTKKLCET